MCPLNRKIRFSDPRKSQRAHPKCNHVRRTNGQSTVEELERGCYIVLVEEDDNARGCKCRRIIGTGRDCRAGMARRDNAILLAPSPTNEPKVKTPCKTCMCARMSGFELERLLQQRNRYVSILRYKGVDKRHALQHEIICIEIVGALSLDPFNLDLSETWLDYRDHTHRYVILHDKNIIKQTVVTLGPNVDSGLGLDELRAEADAVGHLAYASFEHVAHSQLTAYLLHVNWSTLVDERRITGDDEQRLDA